MDHSPKAVPALASLAAMLLMVAGLQAQGIQLKNAAEILYGSPSSCSQPAVINFQKVRNATPEWKKIRSEGVQKGTARYDLLMQRLTQRVRKSVKAAAVGAGRDCVVRKGDIKSRNGLTVEDLTKQVVRNL